MKTYFYFTNLAFDNVFRTQIISWLRLSSVDFTIVKYKFINRHFFKKSIKKDVELIKQEYNDNLVKYIYLFPGSNMFVSFLNIIIIYLRLGLFKYSKCVIQTRHTSLAKSFKIIKKIKVIYDCRAASADEYKMVSLSNNNYSQKKYDTIINDNIFMINAANKNFFVSNKLKEYYQTKIKQDITQKSVIYPCCADSKIFRFESSVRNTIRTELKIQDKQVVIYSGGLTCLWHIPEKVVRFFETLNSLNDNFYFLILTHDTLEAQKYFENSSICNDLYSIISVSNREVYKYLSASDFGILLREDDYVNSVASPTKFAEYLLCGLKIIISPNVGDYSELVVNNNFGIIYDFQDDAESLQNNLNRIKSCHNKNLQIKYAKENLSKQSYVNKLNFIYQNI